MEAGFILLLHEIDTCLSLLDLYVSDDDEIISKCSSIDAGVNAGVNASVSESAVSEVFGERKNNRATEDKQSDDAIYNQRER